VLVTAGWRKNPPPGWFGGVAMIYFASFWFRNLPPGVQRFSVARWQPRELRPPLPELSFLAPVRKDGGAIVHVPPEQYLDEYAGALRARGRDVAEWLKELDPAADMALLCWCNKQRQPKPGLLCHTILLGWLVEAARPDVRVAYLDGRDDPVWGAGDRQRFLRKVAPVLELCGPASWAALAGC